MWMTGRTDRHRDMTKLRATFFAVLRKRLDFPLSNNKQSLISMHNAYRTLFLHRTAVPTCISVIIKYLVVMMMKCSR